jgi:SAM-dependent methyltransferase
MNVNFGELYSSLYDQIHAEKDYAIEVEQFLNVLTELKVDLDSRFIDFGCGTGGHMKSLQDRGLYVEGYDISEAMLEKAKAKYPNASFHNKLDDLAEKFDVVYTLFDVINYQADKELLIKFLTQMGSTLRENGIMVLDSWQLSGIQADPPHKRERLIQLSGKDFKRVVSPSTTNLYRDTEMQIDIIDQTTGLLASSETHTMRAWTVEEIQSELTKLDFEVLRICDGRKWELQLTPDSWKFALVAKKRSVQGSGEVNRK